MSAIEREFERQKAWIAACDEPQAILDRMAEYREAERAAVRAGSTLGRARCADLLELAEDRVVAIKRARLKEGQREVKKVEVPARQVIAPSPPPRRPELPPAACQKESRDAATRLANAQALKIEAEAALLRAQVEAARVQAQQAPAPDTSRAAPT